MTTNAFLVTVGLIISQLGFVNENQFEDYGGLYVIDTLPPAKITDEIINAVIDNINLEIGFQNIQTPEANTTLDFLRIKDRWFAALIMRRDKSQGIGRCIIGKTFSDQVQYGYLRNIVLDSANMGEYSEVIEGDSAWVYFDDYGFWKDESSWIRLFEQRDGFGLRVIFVSSMNGSGSNEGITENMSSGMWLFDVSLIASKELQEWADAAVPHLPQFTGIDYMAEDSSWFAAIIVHRVSQKVVYSPIVGIHLGDSLLYRHLYGEPIELVGDPVVDYMKLHRNNDLWTLINDGDWRSDETGIRKLWHQAGEGQDSSAITNKLTFPLDK